MPSDPQPAAPDDDEPMPVLAFVLVFMLSPVLMGFVALIAVYGTGLVTDPLGIALTLGHIVTACVLFGAYRVLKKRGSQEED